MPLTGRDPKRPAARAGRVPPLKRRADARDESSLSTAGRNRNPCASAKGGRAVVVRGRYGDCHRCRGIYRQRSLRPARAGVRTRPAGVLVKQPPLGCEPRRCPLSGNTPEARRQIGFQSPVGRFRPHSAADAAQTGLPSGLDRPPGRRDIAAKAVGFPILRLCDSTPAFAEEKLGAASNTAEPRR